MAAETSGIAPICLKTLSRHVNGKEIIALRLGELAVVGIALQFLAALLWSKVSRKGRGLGSLLIVSFEQDFLYVGGCRCSLLGTHRCPVQNPSASAVTALPTSVYHVFLLFSDPRDFSKMSVSNLAFVHSPVPVPEHSRLACLHSGRAAEPFCFSL